MCKSLLNIQCVVFDVGGVLLASPFSSIEEYEKKNNLPKRFFGQIIMNSGADGAFQRLEDGRLSRKEFVEEFNREISVAIKENHNGLDWKPNAEGWLRFLEETMKPNYEFLNALAAIKQKGLMVGVITNNWEQFGGGLGFLKDVDVVVESYKVKRRKPDPKIYKICFDALHAKKPSLKPEQIVFVDDIGINCKAAKDLGWHAIRVLKGKEKDAILQLKELVGISNL